MKKAGFLVIIGSSLLLGLFFFPLWNIMLGAPQYPEPLGMNIYINKIEGVKEFDLQNIDGLNHYIGMKKIPKASEMWQFKVFPLTILMMSLLGVIMGIGGFLNKVKPRVFLMWLGLMSFFCFLGMYNFNLWLLDYGSDLDPKAILKIVDSKGNPMSYEPPLFGYRKILNFDAYSLPNTGAYIMVFGFIMIFISYFIGKRELKKS